MKIPYWGVEILQEIVSFRLSKWLVLGQALRGRQSKKSPLAREFRRHA